MRASLEFAAKRFKLQFASWALKQQWSFRFEVFEKCAQKSFRAALRKRHQVLNVKLLQLRLQRRQLELEVQENMDVDAQ